MLMLAITFCSFANLGGASCSVFSEVLSFEGTGQEDCRHYDVVLAVDTYSVPLVARTCEPDEVRDALEER